MAQRTIQCKINQANQEKMKTSTITIQGRDYMFCKSLNAGYDDKFKRMVKLAARFDELDAKFDRMIEKGSYVTDTARCALACKMMMHTGIRIGNEGSAEGYMTKPHPNSKKEPEFVQTYGLTTLLPQHVTVKGRTVYLNFIGKKSVENSFTITGNLAKQVKEVLKTVEDGETLFEVTEYELTKFIKRYVGRRFTPKDFRTMRANMCAWEKVLETGSRPLPRTKTEYNKEVKGICEYVSEKLNNTPGVCKKSYIDGDLWELYASMRPVTKGGAR